MRSSLGARAKNNTPPHARRHTLCRIHCRHAADMPCVNTEQNLLCVRQSRHIGSLVLQHQLAAHRMTTVALDHMRSVAHPSASAETIGLASFASRAHTHTHIHTLITCSHPFASSGLFSVIAFRASRRATVPLLGLSLFTPRASAM